MAPNIPEKINAANVAFHRSEDKEVLKERYTEIRSLLKKDKEQKMMYLTNTTRQDSEVLAYRLLAKIYTLQYYDGYYTEDGEKLIAFLRTSYTHAKEKEYNATADFCKNLLDFTEKTMQVMEEAKAYILRVEGGESGDISQITETDYEEAKQFLVKKIEEITEYIMPENGIYGKNVKIFDLKDRVLKDLTVEKEEIDKKLSDIQEANESKFLAECVKPLEEVYPEGCGEYYPVLPLKENSKANCVVLCTPFEQEAYLYVASYAKDENIPFLVLELSALRGKSKDTVKKLFRILKESGKACLITGADSYRDLENKETVYREMMLLGKSGRRVFVLDKKGDRKVYNDAFDVAKDADSLTVMDVSYIYLTMPAYRDVIALFEEKGLITGADYTEIREKMPFMGFCGLNKVAQAFAGLKDWKRVGAAWSDENRHIAFEYLAKLPTQTQLLDSDWGDYSHKTLALNDKKKDFDYDDIKTLNPNNVRKIVEGNYSLFQKCGGVASYCLSGGEDSSIWKTLSPEIKSERLTFATKLVMRLLDVDIDPEVQVIPEEEWTSKAAGGMCIDGGKKIIYRESSVLNYDWTVGAVCHECFHSFQHKAEDEGWRSWHWDELGVTKGRVAQWKNNHYGDPVHKSGKYFDISKNKDAYMVQIIESDARAFESDCVEAYEKIFSKIDFE